MEEVSKQFWERPTFKGRTEKVKPIKRTQMSLGTDQKQQSGNARYTE